MFFAHLTTAFLVLASIASILLVSPAWATALVEMAQEADGSYAWEGFKALSKKPSKSSLKSLTEDAFDEMESECKQMKYARPSTMAGFYIKDQGVIFASSIKGIDSQSQKTTDLNECSTRYNGNCAEMNAISLAKYKKFSVENGMVAVFGVKTKAEGKNKEKLAFLDPCGSKNGKSGCGDKIPSSVEKVKRDVIAVEFTA